MISRDAVIDILTAITAGDRRTVGQADIDLWAAALTAGGVTSRPDAIQAVVQHFATSTAWITPAHVIGGVKAIRAKRLEQADPVEPNVDPDDWAAYRAEHRAIRSQIAEGTFTREAYELGGVTLTGATPRWELGAERTSTTGLGEQLRAIAASKVPPRTDLSDGGEKPKAPSATVGPRRAQELEEERDKQLVALGSMAREAS